MPRRGVVAPYAHPLTDVECRELLSRPLLRLCSAYGPTKVALTIGCKTDKTVRNARDERSTLGLDNAANLLLMDPTALDGILGHFGRRSVPVEATCNTDDQAAQSSVLKTALALSIALEDGIITDAEVRDNAGTIQNTIDALHGLLARLGPKKVRA